MQSCDRHKSIDNIMGVTRDSADYAQLYNMSHYSKQSSLCNNRKSMQEQLPVAQR